MTTQLTREQVKAVREKWPFYKTEELYGLHSAGDLGRMLPIFKAGKRVGRCRQWVVGMKRAGYQFTDGVKTNLISALVWTCEHPEFNSCAYKPAKKGVA